MSFNPSQVRLERFARARSLGPESSFNPSQVRLERPPSEPARGEVRASILHRFVWNYTSSPSQSCGRHRFNPSQVRLEPFPRVHARHHLPRFNPSQVRLERR